MIRVNINELGDYLSKEVTLSGWVYNKRSSGNIWFLVVRDGYGYTQGVVSRENVSDEIFNLESAITQESSISITGIVKEDKRSVSGYELNVIDIKIHQVASEYPISKKEHGTAFLMDNRHLWLRSRKQNAILRIRAEVVRSIRDYLDSNGFVNLDTPIFTANACEGTTTLFETDYFGQKAYLAQSGQLYNEANVMSFGKVYSFGPTFRAERSKTRRHLTEFWMVEPEIAYCNLEKNMDWAEGLICHIIDWCLEKCKDQLYVLERDMSKLKNIKKPFPRITYTKAVEILNRDEKTFDWGGDFGSGDETRISEYFDAPVIVHRFPAAIKAFYMKRDAKDEKLALGMDILAPEGYGEVIGGGEREDDYSTLEKRILKHKLPKEAYQWYLDLRKYGTVPHAGFGLGVERVVSWICGLSHLRESIPFPRMIYRLEP